MPLIRILGTVLFWVFVAGALILYLVVSIRDYHRKIGRRR
jgi:hypothetical protein